MESIVIDKINVSMRISFKSEKTTKKIYEALMLESDYDPNERAKTKIEIESSTLIISIQALDSVSARAASNSFLKWINLSEQLLTYVDETKK